MVKNANENLDELIRHNESMEAIALGKSRTGDGLYLKPYKSGLGLYLKPYEGLGLKNVKKTRNKHIPKN